MIFDKLLKSREDVKQKISDSIEQGETLLLTYFNQHCFNIYTKNDTYKKLIDSHFIVYQADLGVFFALKFFSEKKIKRIDATKMNEIIIEELINRKFKVAIVGGNYNEEFIQTESLRRGINFAGYINGYLDDSCTEDVIRNLNDLDSQVYFIGMGVPKQEIFAEKLSQFCASKVIICVGNFFEFYFGTKKRAPLIIQKVGFEWLFRLIQEPQRLYKRYLVGIPVFFVNIIRLKFFKNKIL